MLVCMTSTACVPGYHPPLPVDLPSPEMTQPDPVMVVDDEASILDITKQTLLAFGYRALTAEDGAQAISVYALQRDEIALVLTDMMMPVMDGTTLILALQRINPRIRVIAASGLKGNHDVARAASAGVKHFLPKPYSADTLLQLINQVLHDGGSRPQSRAAAKAVPFDGRHGGAPPTTPPGPPTTTMRGTPAAGGDAVPSASAMVRAGEPTGSLGRGNPSQGGTSAAVISTPRPCGRGGASVCPGS